MESEGGKRRWKVKVESEGGKRRWTFGAIEIKYGEEASERGRGKLSRLMSQNERKRKRKTKKILFFYCHLFSFLFVGEEFFYSAYFHLYFYYFPPVLIFPSFSRIHDNRRRHPVRCVGGTSRPGIRDAICLHGNSQNERKRQKFQDAL